MEVTGETLGFPCSFTGRHAAIRRVIDLVHTRIDAAQDAIGTAALRHRKQRSDAYNAHVRAEREPLHDAARDAESREGSRAFTERNAVKLAHTQTPRSQKLVDHPQQELGMALARMRFPNVRFTVDPNGH